MIQVDLPVRRIYFRLKKTPSCSINSNTKALVTKGKYFDSHPKKVKPTKPNCPKVETKSIFKHNLNASKCLFYFCLIGSFFNNLGFDAFWSNHILRSIVLAFWIEIDFDDFPWDVFAFETSVEEMWDLSVNEHHDNSVSGWWIFGL